MASEETRRFGSCLSRIGMKKGDVLAIMMTNCPEYLIAFLGVTGKISVQFFRASGKLLRL
jgi:acyl-CoA synthetase (AMP-forming)/AMP-acid ligase II